MNPNFLFCRTSLELGTSVSLGASTSLWTLKCFYYRIEGLLGFLNSYYKDPLIVLLLQIPGFRCTRRGLRCVELVLLVRSLMFTCLL